MELIRSIRPSQRLAALLVLLTAAALLLMQGPLAQFDNYHAFADRRTWGGMPNAADLWSNLAFLVVGVWGWFRLRALRTDSRLTDAWPGYALFLGSLMLTAFGSSYYHWAPDDARLVWDRLPIALACAGLLAAAFAEVERRSALVPCLLLGAFAVAGVVWWIYTADLRLYLLLQGMPLILIPIWQHVRKAPRTERLSFASAIGVYALARMAEVYDAAIFSRVDWIGGHTLKHLLAAVACALIVYAVVQRVRVERKDDGLSALGSRKE